MIKDEDVLGSPDAAVWTPHAPQDLPRNAVPEPVVVIEARPDTPVARLRSLWRYRGFYGFLFKEITTRKSRGTLLGFWWLILRPLIPAAGFIFAFAFVHPLDSGTAVPYRSSFSAASSPGGCSRARWCFCRARSCGCSPSCVGRIFRACCPLAGFGPHVDRVAILVAVFAIVVASSCGEARRFRCGSGGRRCGCCHACSLRSSSRWRSAWS